MERKELYQIEETEQLFEKRRKAILAMCIVGGTGLAVCSVLSAFVTMKNYHTLQWIIVGAAVAFGWAVIFLHHAVYGEAARLLKHATRMREGERTAYTGRFEQTDTVLRVRNGVTLRRVRAFCGEHEYTLNLCEAKANLLPAAFTGTVETSDFFIVAAEVSGDV